jgi:hypothetical protein
MADKRVQTTLNSALDPRRCRGCFTPHSNNDGIIDMLDIRRSELKAGAAQRRWAGGVRNDVVLVLESGERT